MSSSSRWALRAVQHGPHLKLNNNERLARYLTTRVQAAASVVIAPTLTYHFYPSFLEYPGSTTLNEDTARDMTVEIVRSLSKSGPRRFYVLNTGRPTVTPLSEAAKTLANDGILLGYTDAAYRLRDVVALQQARITVAHADEVATSMMLFVDPAAVDMKKAVREYASGSGALTRKKDAPGVFSESGVLGDATVATREKGQQLVDALLAGVLEDIENIRKATLPAVRTVPPPPPPAPAPRPAPGRSSDRAASGCTPGDERTIRAIGEKFQLAWRNQDVPLLMTLFGKEADMRHPDGTIERTAEVIGMNRNELFRKRDVPWIGTHGHAERHPLPQRGYRRRGRQMGAAHGHVPDDDLVRAQVLGRDPDFFRLVHAGAAQSGLEHRSVAIHRQPARRSAAANGPEAAGFPRPRRRGRFVRYVV